MLGTCPQCGTMVDPAARSRFCLSCGADLMIPEKETAADDAVQQPIKEKPGNGAKGAGAADAKSRSAGVAGTTPSESASLADDSAGTTPSDSAPADGHAGAVSAGSAPADGHAGAVSAGSAPAADGPAGTSPTRTANAGAAQLVKRVAIIAIAFALAYGVGYFASGGSGARPGQPASSESSSTTTAASASSNAGYSSEGEAASQAASGDEKIVFTNDLFNRSAEDLAENREYASLIGRSFALPFTLSDLVNMSLSERASATSGLYEVTYDKTSPTTRYVYSATEELYRMFSLYHMNELRKKGGVSAAPWDMQLGEGNGGYWGETSRNDIAEGAQFAVSFRGNIPFEEPTYAEVCESVAQVFDYNSIIIFDYESGAQDQVYAFAVADGAYASICISLYGGYSKLDIDVFNPEWDDSADSPQSKLDYYKRANFTNVLYEEER